MRVFLDSNVLFSAAYKRDSRFQRFWSLPDVQIYTSQYSIIEVSRHLSFPSQRAQLWKLVTQSIIVPADDPIDLPGGVKLPAKDAPILLAALSGKVDLLVSGDEKHFGPYYGHTVQDVTIESPRMFKSRYPEHFRMEKPRP